jgi:cobalt/nickel transport system permease protein
VSVCLIPRHISLWAVNIGPLWLSSSPASLYLGISLIARALGAASAMNFLALTTPMVDIVELFRRLHVPEEIIDIMTIIYRYIFVLLGSLERMRMAQDSRLGYQTTYFRAMNSAALLGSQLFIDAYQRSKRLQIALQSRGYTDSLKVLPARYSKDRRILWYGVLVASNMILAWVVV